MDPQNLSASFVSTPSDSRPMRDAKAQALGQMAQMAYGGSQGYLISTPMSQSGNIMFSQGTSSGSSYYPPQYGQQQHMV